MYQANSERIQADFGAEQTIFTNQVQLFLSRNQRSRRSL